MTRARGAVTRVRATVAVGVFVAALVAGTIADVPRPSAARMLGGYHVLAADFHVHSFPFSWSTLSPFDTVLDARHHGLDVVALTPHNHLWVAQAGAWFSRLLDRPLVIVGEEITAPGYHMIGVGLHRTVANTMPAAAAIDEIHRQGGVAIAAHPFREFGPAYDAEALASLDGAEVVRPDSLRNRDQAEQLRQFHARTRAAAIGSTDYHGLGPVGYSRTYVFARDRSEAGVIDAIRDGRIVVYGEDRVHGDPAMVQLAAAAGGLASDVPRSPLPGPLALFGKLGAIGVLVMVLVFNRWD